MQRIEIKPLSVNKCWQGRRFKTPEYKRYEKEALLLLPNDIQAPAGKIGLRLEVGLSNALSDIDNIAKPFIDILQKKYRFNDSQIYRLEMIKDKVVSGDEYINFLMYAI